MVLALHLSLQDVALALSSCDNWLQLYTGAAQFFTQLRCHTSSAAATKGAQSLT